jgi:hypothetical protein
MLQSIVLRFVCAACAWNFFLPVPKVNFSLT